MDILFVVLAGLFALAAVTVLVGLLIGFRPRRGTRYADPLQADDGSSGPVGRDSDAR